MDVFQEAVLALLFCLQWLQVKVGRSHLYLQAKLEFVRTGGVSEQTVPVVTITCLHLSSLLVSGVQSSTWVEILPNTLTASGPLLPLLLPPCFCHWAPPCTVGCCTWADWQPPRFKSSPSIFCFYSGIGVFPGMSELFLRRARLFHLPPTIPPGP